MFKMISCVFVGPYNFSFLIIILRIGWSGDRCPESEKLLPRTSSHSEEGRDSTAGSGARTGNTNGQGSVLHYLASIFKQWVKVYLRVYKINRLVNFVMEIWLIIASK